MTFASEPTTPAIAELGIIRQVFSHHGVEEGLEQLALSLGIFFQAHVSCTTSGVSDNIGAIPSGAQTEWLDIDGQSFGFVFVRDTPLSLAQRQHARLLIDLAGYWFSAVAEINRLKTELEQTSRIDPLTRLANGRYFNEVLKQSIARSARSNLMLAVLHIDLIGFRNLNDQLGDEIGDELLFALAERIKRLVRADDLVARVGPDEFAVLLNHVGSQENVSRIVERFENTLAVAPIPTKLWTGARIGIALYPSDAAQHDTLMNAAQKALASTKHSQEAVHAYYNELPSNAR